ncbi:hypothetical protein MKAN_23030 [Mycobacterium kansasii ATCC 12478]|uniref:Uncharacterized protein n=1 Tax=Mycobacterium kansasii ATCC 12478 TaxID=557599 RepID=U5WZP2_MYCKA|nr:hypothetical protein MKAN_23030 [Mycobacterium kansasii ATCC 12478]
MSAAAAGSSLRGQRRRSRRRPARRRPRRRLAVRIAGIAGIAGDRVRKVQPRLAALTGARERHRQRGCARLTELRIAELRRQQHIGIQTEIGESGVDERLDELTGNQVGDVEVEPRAGGHRLTQ